MWWLPDDTPIDGLNSFYKVIYHGPRFGIRVGGQAGKLGSDLSLSYAILKTKGYGWWNLRDYWFEMNGKNGYGWDLGLNTRYHFTPSLAVGVGFNYVRNFQGRLTESGNDPYEYHDLPIVRNVVSTIYSPSLLVSINW